jgi:hypothetical protein
LHQRKFPAVWIWYHTIKGRDRGCGLLVEEDGDSLELGADGSVSHPVGKDGQEEVEDGETKQNL